MPSADVPSDASSSGPSETRSAGDRQARAPSDGATLVDGSPRDHFSLEPGQVTGDFEIIRLLGSGGYAQVYLARQRSLDRLVALKVSRADGAEGQTLARFDHPNIVPVFREQIVGDRKLLAMRYIPGQTLSRWLAQRASRAGKHWRGAELLDWLAQTPESSPAHEGETRAQGFAALAFVPAVCHLVLDIARALDHAHRQGVIHRDVKPANVLIDPAGHALLMDFNVACRGSDDDQFGGTVAYMAPEHLAAFDAHLPGDRADVDERSDIYSLGIVFMELLASRYQFAIPGDSSNLPGRIRQMLASRLRDAPKLPASVTGVPASVRSILAKCLSAQREDRYPSAAALVEDLERFLRDEPLAHAPDRSLRERTVRWFRRRGRRSVAAGTLGLMMAAGGLWGAYSDLQRIDRAQAKLEWCQRLLAGGDGARACEPLREAEDALTRENRLLPASWTAGRKAPIVALLQRTAAQTAIVELARFREAVDRARSQSWVQQLTNAATDPLAVFRVLDRADWQRIPPYRLLSPAERIEVDAAIAETLVCRACQLADQDIGAPEAAVRIEQMLARVPVAHHDQPIVAALRAFGEDKSRSSLTTEALAAQCRNSFDWYLLGLIAAQRGAYEEALNLLGTALDQGTANDEEEFWTHMARGVCCYRTGRHVEAIAEYGICLGLRPGFAWTHYNLGLVYLKEGEYEPASEEFERASRLDQESGVACAEWGVALFQQARFEESLARFDQAIERGTETARVLTNRAAAKAALGDWTGARKDLQKALVIDPNYEAARDNLRKLDQHASPAT